MALKLKLNANFSNEIEEIVWMKNVDYIDAVIEWCTINNLEVDVVGEIIRKQPIIRAKIQNDAELLNFLPKRSRLPI